MAEASHDAGSLHQEACSKTSGFRSSGQGRGRVRGHGHSYGSRSQKRASLETGPKNTTNADGFKQLKGWKSGKTRGRGGRKRGQWSVGSRSAKNKHKAINKSTGVSGNRGKTKDISLDRTPTSSVLKWNPETMLAAYSPEKSSNSDFRFEDNENGLTSGEYDNIMVDNYPSMYNSRELEYEVHGDEDYDDRAEEEEDDNDDDMDDLVEDEQEDVQRYFNGYSDEDEDMEDIIRKQTGNTDDITESASEYSD